MGSGFFQLARDPLAGIIQGPSGFVKGVGSGIQGAVGGVIGGGFDSLGNITGSLYSVMKQTTGSEDTRDETIKAETMKQGLSQGVKGLGSEIGKGIGGIFKNPF